MRVVVVTVMVAVIVVLVVSWLLCLCCCVWCYACVDVDIVVVIMVAVPSSNDVLCSVSLVVLAQVLPLLVVRWIVSNHSHGVLINPQTALLLPQALIST